MRKHGSLTDDEEINDAAWVAARGAGVGAAKVCFHELFAHYPTIATLAGAEYVLINNSGRSSQPSQLALALHTAQSIEQQLFSSKCMSSAETP